MTPIRKREVPDSLRHVYFDFHWSQEKLWALETEKSELAMAELEWALGLPIWASDPPEKIFDLAPRQVLENPEKFPGHWKRIREADTSFPIHVMLWKNKWLIMDGFHRLLRLKADGANKVNVYKVPASAIENIQPDASLPADFLRHELARRDGKK